MNKYLCDCCGEEFEDERDLCDVVCQNCGSDDISASWSVG